MLSSISCSSRVAGPDLKRPEPATPLAKTSGLRDCNLGSRRFGCRCEREPDLEHPIGVGGLDVGLRRASWQWQGPREGAVPQLLASELLAFGLLFLLPHGRDVQHVVDHLN